MRKSLVKTTNKVLSDCRVTREHLVIKNADIYDSNYLKIKCMEMLRLNEDSRTIIQLLAIREALNESS